MIKVAKRKRGIVISRNTKNNPLVLRYFLNSEGLRWTSSAAMVSIFISSMSQSMSSSPSGTIS